MEDAAARRARKEEAKRQKRKRIEEAGGVRPRPDGTGNRQKETSTSFKEGNKRQTQRQRVPLSKPSGQKQAGHRFGRVMERVPCPNRPRFSTLSIALPGSIVSNCQTWELRTHLVGQVARAAAVYHVDEIVVFDDKLSVKDRRGSGYYRGGGSGGDQRDIRHRDVRDDNGGENIGSNGQERSNDENRTDVRDKGGDDGQRHAKSESHTFMARVLQYCECPQYLRRHFFPMHPDLRLAGLLNPIDAPHHVREGEQSKYREGVVFEKKGHGPQGGSFVNCGIRSRLVEIDRVLTPGIRCTVQLAPKAYTTPGRMKGKVVSPNAPREDDGTYWGYTTRLAKSIKAVFDECPYEGGYDLKVGTSERGNTTVDDKGFKLPTFQHAIIVFGGVAGIEECVDADETISIPGADSKKMFDLWLNICPYQGSRTIRTEEAVLISLASLRPFVAKNNIGKTEKITPSPSEEIQFSDDPPSDESSDGSPSDESSDGSPSDESSDGSPSDESSGED